MDAPDKRAGGQPDGEPRDTRAGSQAAAGTPATELTKEASPRQAFLLQVAELAEGGELRGRVQSLATADGGNFSSVTALIAILRRVLTEPAERTDE
ncbi:MAG TPA: hypothetical protein VN634_08545 [Candidatus Limnocylindrales bacterium]|nr:hypothetical protein [Candidatus Limnocylindrales bacterium]